MGVLLVLPQAAGAATVSTYDGDDDPRVGYEAGASVDDRHGERNDLLVMLDRGRLRVRERGRAPLRAGRGCKRASRRLVTCRVNVVGDVDVNAGAGDDAVRCRGEYVALYGGAGDDRLRSGGCASDLTGGTGDDALIGDRYRQKLLGGAGHDRLLARGGKDVLVGDGVRRGKRGDVLDGGRGRDTASWDERTGGVRVDLTRGVGPGRDRLRAIEDAVGGGGDDVLIGSARANRLYGRYGADLLVGRAGNDVIDAGAGVPGGGEGDDGARDRVRCGRGRDVVPYPGASVLPPSCELMSDGPALDYQTVPARPRIAGRRRIAVPAVCVDDCRRRAVVSSGGVELGRSRTVDPKHNVSWLVVELKRPLRGNAVVRIELSGQDWNSDVYAEGWEAYGFAWRISCRRAPPTDACRRR